MIFFSPWNNRPRFYFLLPITCIFFIFPETIYSQVRFFSLAKKYILICTVVEFLINTNYYDYSTQGPCKHQEYQTRWSRSSYSVFAQLRSPGTGRAVTSRPRGPFRTRLPSFSLEYVESSPQTNLRGSWVTRMAVFATINAQEYRPHRCVI